MNREERVQYAYKCVQEEAKIEAIKAGNKEIVKLIGKNINNLVKKDFDINEFEVANFALYKADEYIKVKQYISENPKAFRKILLLALTGQKVALFGDTGIGKGRTLDEMLSELGIKAIITVPLRMLSEQMSNKYELMEGSYGSGGKSIATLIKENTQVIVCTWDKLKTALDNDVDMTDYILIRDEVHELFSNDYRGEVVRCIEHYSNMSYKKFKGILDVTATPTRLDKAEYDYIVKYEKTKKPTKKRILYNKICTDTIISILSKSKKALLVEDNIENLKCYESKLKDTGKNIEVVYSDIKDSSATYKKIVKDSTVGACQILLATNILGVGLNFLDDVEDIIIVGKKSPDLIEQIDSRYRLAKKLNVHIFNSYTKNKKNFFRIERQIREQVCATQIVVNAINESLAKYKKEEGFDFNTFHRGMCVGSKDSFMFLDNGEYVVDTAKIRTATYEEYYKTRDREQFKVLLSEYGTNIELKDVDSVGLLDEERKKLITGLRKNNKELLKDLCRYRKLLVGCSAILKGEELTEDLKAYYDRNNINIDELKITYKTLGITLEDSLFIQHNKQFTTYVTENNYDLDFAWKWASLSETDRKKALLGIDFLKYMKLRETDSKAFKNALKYNPSLTRLDYLYNELSIGIGYTNDVHLPLLLKGMNKKTPKSIGDKEFKFMINTVISSSRKNTKATSNDFYKGKLPKKKDKRNLYNYYSVKGYITLEDIASLIGVDSANITLNRLINE